MAYRKSTQGKSTRTTSTGGISIWKKALSIVLVLGISTAGYAGWDWLRHVVLTEVQMQGQIHSTESEVRQLIQVDSGAVMFELDPRILEDRIRRHPWIMDAHVSRLPTGLLDIRIVERHPVAQVLNPRGDIGYYLDRNGYRMPISPVKWYPVPIISGPLERYHPVSRITDNVLKDMLLVLPEISQQADAMLSELLRVDTGFEIRTTPVGNHESIHVLMGDSDFESRFTLLEAFWEQEVLVHQDIAFASIDLRFNSQVVTKQVLRPPPSKLDSATSN